MLAVLVLSACVSNLGFTNLEKELMAVDSAFSQMSLTEGMDAAFAVYMAEDGMALPQKGDPRNKDEHMAILKQISQGENASTLVWSPVYADVAESGDLGYTWGRYVMTYPDSDGELAKINGYYFTIWKRQSDGTWKFVLDGGNTVND